MVIDVGNKFEWKIQLTETNLFKKNEKKWDRPTSRRPTKIRKCIKSWIMQEE